MCIMIPGLYTGYVVALGWIANTLPRPPAKRAAGQALINAVSNASTIWASYLYVGSPRFRRFSFPLRSIDQMNTERLGGSG